MDRRHTDRFVAADQGHDVESTEGRLQEGPPLMAGALNRDLTTTLEKPGI